MLIEFLIEWCDVYTGSNLSWKCAIYSHEEATWLQVQEWDVPVCKMPRCLAFRMVSFHQLLHTCPKRIYLRFLLTVVWFLLQAPLLYYFCTW